MFLPFERPSRQSEFSVVLINEISQRLLYQKLLSLFLPTLVYQQNLLRSPAFLNLFLTQHPF